MITVRPEVSIRSAAGLLTRHNVSGLPVVEEHSHVVGIVSDGDLIIQQKPGPGRRPRDREAVVPVFGMNQA